MKWKLSDLSYLAQLTRNAYYQQSVASTPALLRQAQKQATELERAIQQIQQKAKEDLFNKKYDNTFWG
jgi:hypothetical protein